MQALPIPQRNDKSAQKAKLRTEAASRRKEAWLSNGASAAASLVDRGVSLAESFPLPRAVGAYYPLRAELDPLQLLTALHGKGFLVALPRTAEGPMLCFREWKPGSALERTKFGLREPAETESALDPALIFVPLLAFDRTGNRLGYGAGYYDAYLRRARCARTVVAIGIAFDEQEFPEIPREPQDERLDMVLTPSRVIACEE